MKLYILPGACSLAPHIVLNELGLKFEIEKINPAQKSENFLKDNPKGSVPALVLDDGQTLTEVAVILQYLADKHPDKKLFPDWGTFDRYRAMELLNYLASDVHKGFANLWALQRLTTITEAHPQIRDFTVAGLSRRFEYLENKLTNRSFLLGETFSICDAYFFTLLEWTRYHRVDMAKYPNIMSFVERMQMRPAVDLARKTEKGK